MLPYSIYQRNLACVAASEGIFFPILLGKKGGALFAFCGRVLFATYCLIVQCKTHPRLLSLLAVGIFTSFFLLIN
jgi:hypothetical protein